jgi:hypothetical protein
VRNRYNVKYGVEKYCLTSFEFLYSELFIRGLRGPSPPEVGFAPTCAKVIGAVISSCKQSFLVTHLWWLKSYLLVLKPIYNPVVGVKKVNMNDVSLYFNNYLFNSMVKELEAKRSMVYYTYKIV